MLLVNNLTFFRNNIKIFEDLNLSLANRQIIQIKGIAQSDTSRLVIDITDESGTIVSTLETPITSDGTFSLPWVIPSTFDTGTYTITIHDADNSDSIEIFIQ